MSAPWWPWTRWFWPWRGWLRKKYWSARAGKQADAADFNLAVTLVAPWEEYVIDLSPAFALKDGDAARAHVIPDTGSLEEKILDSWSGSGQASVAVAAKQTAAGESVSGAAAAHDDAPKGKGKGAAAKGKPAGQQREGGDTASAVASVPSKQSRASGAGHATGKDPMLEYAAATALYQEVKLLNRYVADAALRRDYRAYVVRLQMSVVPFARHFPLDVYCNISFFPKREPTRPETGTETAAAETPEETVADTPAATPTATAAKPQRHRAEVIPLLVTDNLENTIKSRTVDSLRNLAVTLNFLNPGVRGGASLGQKQENFKRALGGDLNSLLTVGRVSDNTLQVRLGAERDPTCEYDYTILPRTHNITVLVMVPREFAEDPDLGTVPRITAVAKTQLRHSVSGTELEREGESGRRERIKKLLKDTGRRQDVDVDKMLKSVFSNDVDAFQRHSKTSEDQVMDLWCDIVENLGKNEFAAVRFELPPPAQLPTDEAALALDDGEKTVLRLQGGAGLNQNGVTATLFVTTKEGEIPIVPHAEPPDEEIVILAGGHGMTITFPSLSVLNVIPAGPVPAGSSGPLRLRLRYAAGRKWSVASTADDKPLGQGDDGPGIYKVLYRKVKPVKPSRRKRTVKRAGKRG
jgi:hypothetical protein